MKELLNLLNDEPFIPNLVSEAFEDTQYILLESFPDDFMDCVCLVLDTGNDVVLTIEWNHSQQEWYPHR